MKKITLNDIVLFVSDDMYKEEVCSWKKSGLISPRVNEKILNDLSDIVDPYLSAGDPFNSYIKGFAKQTGKQKIAILYAHGFAHPRGWAYLDGDTTGLVQNWIDANDGKYACLIIVSCNPRHQDVTCSASLLLSPDRIVGKSHRRVGFVSYIFLHPTLGEIDGYVIDYELQKLELSVSKKKRKS